MAVRIAAAEVCHFQLPAHFRILHLFDACLSQIVDHVPDLVAILEGRQVGIISQQDPHGQAARVGGWICMDLFVEVGDTFDDLIARAELILIGVPLHI